MSSHWTTSGPALHLTLSPGGGRRQALEDELRRAVRDGRLVAGTRLPASRTLAADLGLSRGTVVEAFAQLVAEGYLEARHGSGTWVRELPATGGGDPSPEPAPSARPARFSLHPGVPDLTAFPERRWVAAVRSGLRTTPAAALGYGDPRGSTELRQELAWYLARARGVVCDPELVVVCSGFRHGLSLVARALRDRGVRRVAMEEPCVVPHRAGVRASGLVVVSLPVDARGARTDLLEGLHVSAAVLTPARQFPLGMTLHPERRAHVAAWAANGDRLVVEDDYDGELRYDRQPAGALQALLADHVVYGGTASKTLAPGLRLAWLVVPRDLLEPVLRLRRLEDVHVPAPEQAAFRELLATGAYEQHVRRIRARYRARRDRLVEMLAERAPWARPAGISAGLSMLIELPEGATGQRELVDRARRRSIELFPLSFFYADPTGARPGLVIGYGALPEHDLEAGFEALCDVLAGVTA